MTDAFNMVECSMEEVAERMSLQEGRAVSVAECRKLEFSALRKIRILLRERGIEPQDIIPGLGRRRFPG